MRCAGLEGRDAQGRTALHVAAGGGGVLTAAMETAAAAGAMEAAAAAVRTHVVPSLCCYQVNMNRHQASVQCRLRVWKESRQLESSASQGRSKIGS